MLSRFGDFLLSFCWWSCFRSSVATAWENTDAADRNRRRKHQSVLWSAPHLVYLRSFLPSPLDWQPRALMPEGRYCSTRRTQLGRPTCVQASFPGEANKFVHSSESTWTPVWKLFNRATSQRE